MTSTTFIRSIQAPMKVLEEGNSGSFTWAHVRVESQADVARLLSECSEKQIFVLCGKPRELPAKVRGSADSSTQVVFLDLAALAKVREHFPSDQVISVETGMMLSTLDALLQKSGQWWPVSLDPNRTIYDVIASGDGGVLEHGFGGPRRLVLGLEVALTNGNVIKTGGKVVKNVTGYDMTKLFVGSRGTLGVPCLAHLRISARPSASVTLVLTGGSELSDFISQANTFMSSGLPLAVLEIVDSDSFVSQLTQKDRISLCSQFTRPLSSNLMIVQIYEHEKVLADVVPSLEQMVAANMVLARTPSELSQAVVRGLSSPAKRFFELDCSARSVPTLLDALEKRGATAVQIRPGVGRTRFASETSLQSLSERLAEVCKRHSLQASLGEVNGDALAVSHLPTEDKIVTELHNSTKQRFDPAGCLNPFVSF